ncbi:DNA cytosine methyltransferase [Pseudomonas sp. S2_A10]
MIGNLGDTMMQGQPTIVDLFCGCGGFGLGAELAGFKVLAAVDVDPNLQSAYRLNFPNVKAVLADISLLTKDFWKETIGNIKPDGVIGGPPCQGFSRIGLRQPEDPRNNLVMHFFKQVNILQPKFFVMENVEGILDSQNKSTLELAIASVDKRYTVVGPFKVNALDCGAATSRKRVVVVGYDSNCMSLPDISSLMKPDVKSTTVREAISDLPSPCSLGNSLVVGGFRWVKATSDDVSDYASNLKLAPLNGLGSSISVEMLANGYVSGVLGTKHTPAVVERFAATPPGKIEAVSRYPRLSWDGYCPTLRAGTGSDKGSFQAMRPIHPLESRVITVREAARLQGFPDWFLFHPTIWHSFRMIGNSVSPVMSKYLLDILSESILRKMAA